MKELQYIILDQHKRPTHPFRDGIGAKTKEEVRDCPNVGVIVPKPFIVLDFDTIDQAEIMLSIIEAYDLKCLVMQTTRGIHVWFRSEEPWKCFVNTRLACGLYADCRSHSKNSYVKVRDNGQPRKILRQCRWEEIQEIPKYLYPLNAPATRYDFKNMKDGEGRNQQLFTYIPYMQSKGYTKEEIRECLRLINDHVFMEPLEEKELNTICRDEAFKDRVIQSFFVDESGKFSQSEFGNALIDEFHIINLNDQLYIYKDGYYQEDCRAIERKMIKICPDIKNQQRSEILNYIKIKTYKRAADLKTEPYIINLENTRLDIRDNTMHEFTPDVIEFDRLPVFYNPYSYCEEVDKLFKRLFLDDEETIHLVEEMLGYCLIKHCKYEKGFLFTGSGSNGKSTFLELVKAFLGERNYSSLELDKVTNRFSTASLENKLANIGDDINAKALSETGTLKKLFSGQSLEVERKGIDGYTLKPYAKHIYSCNEIPRSYDKTDGFYRRWIMIPFNAKFSPNDEDYDPLISEKIVTSEALSYVLNRALIGAKRLISQGCFTEPSIVQQTLEDYKINNSLVLSWMSDIDQAAEYLLSKPQEYLYSEFTDWCHMCNIKDIPTKRRFTKEVYDSYDMTWVQRRNPVNMDKKITYFTMKV